MKQNIKKVLLALMAGIGMMVAVSVQAQTQEKVWVKVSNYLWNGQETNDYDAVCRGSYHDKSTIPGEYIGKYEGPLYWNSERGVVLFCLTDLNGARVRTH